MKISVILKNKPDRQGRQTVVIRIADRDTRTFHNTNIRVTPKQFDKGKIVGHPQANTYNNIIKKLLLQYETEELTGTNKQDTPTVDFYKFAEDEIKGWQVTKKPSTLEQYQAELTKLARFRKTVSLTDITPAFLEEYQTHMQGIGNCSNTMWKTFKAIAKLVRTAKKKKLIPEDPFELFDGPKYREPKKDYLTKQQIDRVEQFAKETPSLELSFCALWFVIGCYTGLRFGDMQAFDEKKNIVGGRLIVHTAKTGEIVSMPVSDKLKSLFERVNWKPLHYSNQAYNRFLKTIAALTDIDINVTGHCSRHSAAIMWANAGMSLEVAAKLLGHTNTKNTAIYFKISGQRIDEELKRIGL